MPQALRAPVPNKQHKISAVAALPDGRRLGRRCRARLSSCARERSLGTRWLTSSPAARRVSLALVVVTAVTAIALAGDRARGRAPACRAGVRLALRDRARLPTQPRGPAPERRLRLFLVLRSLAFDRTSISRTTTRSWVCGTSHTCSSRHQRATPNPPRRSARQSSGPRFSRAAHLTALRLRADHPDIDANGISFPYRQAVCVAGLLYGLIGCWFCFRLTRAVLREYAGGTRDDVAVSGSFILWYLVKEPSMTHGPSMAAVAGFAWAWIATRERHRRTTRQWAWLGAIAGFMTLIRWQNALFAVLPACDAIVALWPLRARRIGRAPFACSRRRDLSCAHAGFHPPDDRLARNLRSWLAVSPFGPQIRWTDPQTRRYPLVVAQRATPWSPILYAGGIGLICSPFSGRRRDPGPPRHCPDEYFNAFSRTGGAATDSEDAVRRNDPVLLSRRRGARALGPCSPAAILCDRSRPAALCSSCGT